MLGRLFYRYVSRRTSTFVFSMVVTAVFFERAYDHACEALFEWINEGRLWRDIKGKYEDASISVAAPDTSQPSSPHVECIPSSPSGDKD